MISAFAPASPGVSEARASHSSSMAAGSGDVKSAPLIEADHTRCPLSGRARGYPSALAGESTGNANRTRQRDRAGTVKTVPTTYPHYTQRLNYRRPRWRRIVVVLVVVALVCGGLAYAGYRIYQRVSTALIVPGCQAGSGTSALPLGQDQAPIAATVAGVAARMGLPLRALEVGYATALQE